MVTCFQCAEAVVELAADDPARNHERYHYAPAFVVEVLPGDSGGGSGSCRAAILCWSCMVGADLDLWLSEEIWDAGNPAVAFAHLPFYDHANTTADDPQMYASITVVPRRDEIGTTHER